MCGRWRRLPSRTRLLRRCDGGALTCALATSTRATPRGTRFSLELGRLRNVARTAPYLHDGQLPTLDAVLDHYETLSPDRLHADGEQILRPLRLQGSDRADLLAFLHSLSDRPARRPVRGVTDVCTGSP